MKKKSQAKSKRNPAKSKRNPAKSKRNPAKSKRNPVARRRSAAPARRRGRRAAKRNPVATVLKSALIAGGAGGVAAFLNAKLDGWDDAKKAEAVKAAKDPKAAGLPEALQRGAGRAALNAGVGIGLGLLLDRVGGKALASAAEPVAAGFVAYAAARLVHEMIEDAAKKKAEEPVVPQAGFVERQQSRLAGFVERPMIEELAGADFYGQDAFAYDQAEVW